MSQSAVRVFGINILAYTTFGDPVSVSVVSPGATLLKSVGRRTLRRIAQVFTIENGGVRCHQ